MLKLKPSMLAPHPYLEVLNLKDSDKLLIDYRDSPARKKMQNFIKAVTKHCAAFDIRTSDSEKIVPVFRRVFNNSSFELGGRFYSSYQNLSQIDRLQLKIDGESVAELDYKGLHIAMLYALEGLVVPMGDVYTVPGHEAQRSQMKKALQACLNASTPIKAAASIQRELNQNKIKDIGGRQIIELFANFHPSIKKYFCSGIGSKLQYLDSKMAEYILGAALEDNICVLSVHDSFIVKLSDSQWLEDRMKEASLSVLGVEFGIDSKNLDEIKSKGASKERKIEAEYVEPNAA